MLAVGLIGGATASASDAPTPAAIVQGVVIGSPDADPVSSPAAVAPGTSTSVRLEDWASSHDQPTATFGLGTGTAASDRGVNSGRAQLKHLTLFGGEITLKSLTIGASTAGQSIDLDAWGLRIDGTHVDVPAPDDDPLALGDWGTLSTGIQSSDDPGRTVIALLVTLTADHDGLPAGSTIAVGAITLAAPQAAGGDGGNGGGSGGDGGGTPTPTPTHHHHHHHQNRGDHTRHSDRGTRHHRTHHVKVTHPKHLPQLGRGLRGRVVEAAAEQIGWPYVWGGESRAEGGFDCSGLVDYAYAAAGHPLAGRPTAAVLWQMGIPISADELRPGDLAFLGAPSGDPYHVALYAGNGMVIVASGRGRPIAEEPLDSAPWDGFARIWAPDAGPVLKDARWLTASVKKQSDAPLRFHSDIVAAARAARTPPPAVKPSATHVQVPPAPPAPKPSPDRDSTFATLADLRLRLEHGVRAALGVPTA